MKITRRQLRQLIAEAIKGADLGAILQNRGPEQAGKRRIARRDTRGREIKTHAPRGFVRDIGDEPQQIEGVPAIVSTTGDIVLSSSKKRSLTKESPFVGGSPNFHATYNSNYTEDDLSFFIKKYDPSIGRERAMKIRRDEPDHQVGDYVINHTLFDSGEMGVMEIIADNRGTNDFRMNIDGENVIVPLLTLRSITSGRTISNVGKAFVKKVAGSRSLHKAKEIELDFSPRLEAYRE